jgi:hypothetical protein
MFGKCVYLDELLSTQHNKHQSQQPWASASAPQLEQKMSKAVETEEKLTDRTAEAQGTSITGRKSEVVG